MPRRKKARRKPAPRVPPQHPLDYCPGCGEYKSLEEWQLAEGESLPERAFVCRDCRGAKKDPRAESLPALSGRSRRILRDLIVCRSVAEAARRNGLSPRYVQNMLRGTTDRRNVEGERLRAAWQELLTMEGLDLLTIARLARISLHAMRPYWNKREERWDFFPDHMARIQVMRWAAAMQDVGRPPRRDEPRGAAPSMLILDLGGAGQAPPDSFTIEGEVVKEKEEAS